MKYVIIGLAYILGFTLTVMIHFSGDQIEGRKIRNILSVEVTYDTR